MLRDYVVCLTFLILTGVLPSLSQDVLSVSPKNTQSSAVISAHALQISAGDLLDLSVFDTPELSAKLRVDEHGNVSPPLAGVLPVSGMTAEQAADAIAVRLGETNILKDPHVSVTVLEYATQGVTVVGEVKNPGVYPLLGAHGVLDLISAAGGVTSSAGKDVTVTRRDDPSHPVITTIGSKPGSTTGFNVDIHPGDTVMVSHAGIVYVIGDVGKPGGFLIENNDRLTVLQALALAEGTNRTASLSQAKLIRKTHAGREEIPVPLKKLLANKSPDLMLADGDILFVPGSAMKNALRTMESVLPSAAGAAIYRAP
jgi:polysaccharide export outer membrane protein